MAIIQNNDPYLCGRYGNLIVYNSRGRNLMRTMPKKTNHTPTHGQLLYRAKFTLVASFLAPLRQLIAKSYSDIPKSGRTRHNTASSYHIINAIQGDYPDFSIHYKKAVLSRGPLPSLAFPVAAAFSNYIELNWQVNTDQALGSADDKLVLVAHHPVFGVMIYDEATRQSGNCIFALPSNWTGSNVNVWATFSNVDGNSWSNSIYLGMFSL